MPGGRPVEWTDERKAALLAAFLAYIEESDIPIIAEFAYKNGIHKQRLYEFSEFADAIKLCTTKKEAALETMGLSRDIDTTMAIFSLKQLGWRDKQEIEVDASLEIKHTFDPEGI